MEVEDFYLKRIFEAIDNLDQYLRINSTMPRDMNPEMDLATAQNMETPKKLGEKLFEENKDVLTNWFKV